MTTLEQQASDFIHNKIPHNSAIYVTMKKQEIINIVKDAYMQAHIKVEELEKELTKYKNNEGSKQKINNKTDS